MLRLPAMVSSGCCRCGVSAWVAARWQCSNKKQLPTHQRGSLLARNSASRAVQRSVAVPLRFPGRCLPLGKETWSYPAAVGRAGHSDRGPRVSTLHITIATVRGEAAPSLSPSDFLRQFSPAGGSQRPLGSWARLLLTLYQTGTRLLHQQQHNTAPFYPTMAKHRAKFKVPRWGQFSFPGLVACKVEVLPLQAQVWGVHAGMTQLY